MNTFLTVPLLNKVSLTGYTKGIPETTMLNFFPIQFLAPLAYFLLRVCVGCILIRLGSRHFAYRAVLAPQFNFSIFPFPRIIVFLMIIAEMVAGALLIAGLATQLAALFTAVLAFKMIMLHKRFSDPFIPSRMTYTLLFFASLSLFITGAGAFAFDLPI